MVLTRLMRSTNEATTRGVRKPDVSMVTTRFTGVLSRTVTFADGFLNRQSWADHILNQMRVAGAHRSGHTGVLHLRPDQCYDLAMPMRVGG